MQDEKCRWYNKGFCLKGLAGTKCELVDCVAHITEEDWIMNIKSLMIGDYVQMKVLRMNKVFEKEAVMMPYRVVEVRERLVLERVNTIGDDDRYITISCSYVVEPIPLTKKILEKNGFKDIGDSTYTNLKKNHVGFGLISLGISMIVNTIHLLTNMKTMSTGLNYMEYQVFTNFNMLCVLWVVIKK